MLCKIYCHATRLTTIRENLTKRNHRIMTPTTKNIIKVTAAGLALPKRAFEWHKVVCCLSLRIVKLCFELRVIGLQYLYLCFCLRQLRSQNITLADCLVTLKLKQANLLAQNRSELGIADTFYNCGQPLNHNDMQRTPNEKS